MKRERDDYFNMQDRGDYIPTPEQIKAGCIEVQAGWDEREEMQRRSRREYNRDFSRAVRIGE
jgi:hypothetical protein